MVAKLRLLAAFGALFMAAVVVWQSAPPATVGGPKVELRSTAAPMDPPTTMKSPIVATTDPSPFDPCRDIPFDVVQRLGLGFTPPDARRGAALPLRRRQLPAGRRADHLAQVRPVAAGRRRRDHDQRPPRRAMVEPQADVPQQLLLLLLHGGVQDQLRGHPAVAVLLDDLLQPGGRLPGHQPAARQRAFAVLQVLSPLSLMRP